MESLYTVSISLSYTHTVMLLGYSNPDALSGIGSCCIDLTTFYVENCFFFLGSLSVTISFCLSLIHTCSHAIRS